MLKPPYLIPLTPELLDRLGPIIEENFKHQVDSEGTRSGDGWEGAIGGACPLQGDGTVDGYPWYFRARHEHWSFEVATTQDGDAVCAGDNGGFYTEGVAEGDPKDIHRAGWMAYSEAWRHIESAVALYRVWVSQPRVNPNE